MSKQLTVTQIRSSIGSKPQHRATLRALGLGRIPRSRGLPDNPAVRGMVEKVRRRAKERRGSGWVVGEWWGLLGSDGKR